MSRDDSSLDCSDEMRCDSRLPVSPKADGRLRVRMTPAGVDPYESSV